jgi:uncharacterized membrane protein YphA (DoxX/SURF4 family)
VQLASVVVGFQFTVGVLVVVPVVKRVIDVGARVMLVGGIFAVAPAVKAKNTI